MYDSWSLHNGEQTKSEAVGAMEISSVTSGVTASLKIDVFLARIKIIFVAHWFSWD
jgi:hypothetical protein